MKYHYLQRVRIKTPFYQGHYGMVVGYHYHVDEKTKRTAREYEVLIENGHTADPITFPCSEIEPA